MLPIILNVNWPTPLSSGTCLISSHMRAPFAGSRAGSQQGVSTRRLERVRRPQPSLRPPTPRGGVAAITWSRSQFQSDR